MILIIAEALGDGLIACSKELPSEDVRFIANHLNDIASSRDVLRMQFGYDRISYL